MNFLAAIILLGVLIFIHELGHFLAGVIMKAPIEVFSIGFGPTILKKTIKGVRFQISILPFGGYCKFKGENPSESDGDVNDFINGSPLKRIFICFAGPFANYLLAVLIFMIVLTFPTTRAMHTTEIDVFENYKYISGREGTTLAYQYGLRSGDIIKSVNDKNVETDTDIMLIISDIREITKNEKVKFVVDRGGGFLTFFIPSNELISSLNSGVSLGFLFGTSLILEKIVPNSAAEEVALKAGDEIIKVDGMDVSYLSELRPYIITNANNKITFTILRGREEIDRDIIPENNKGTGVIGVQFANIPFKTENIPGVPFPLSFEKAVFETFNYLKIYSNGIILLVTGKLPLRESLSGPVRIMQITAEVAKDSIYSLLQLGAIISLILFFMNLLPLPVVDGGMIVVALIELISRKKINREVLAKIQIIGAFVLITLAIFITINDITFLVR